MMTVVELILATSRRSSPSDGVPKMPGRVQGRVSWPSPFASCASVCLDTARSVFDAPITNQHERLM